jgi:hypothetical protein
MTTCENLPWGKSPFDDMPHEELLFWARRMYVACEHARGALSNIESSMPPGHLFWSVGGTGGHALRMCTFVVKEVQRRFDHESIYRSFYRYAVDLLFPVDLQVGRGWHRCLAGECDILVINYESKKAECPAHPGAETRAITWEDLSPEKTKQSAHSKEEP